MSFNRWRLLSFLTIISGFIIMWLGFNSANRIYRLFGYLGIAVFVFGIVIKLAKNRCPHCGKYFYFRPEFLIGRYCPYCGKEL